MTEKEQELFYIGASVYLNLDYAEIDDILAETDLSVGSDSVEDCRAAVRAYHPERFEFVHGMRPF